MATSLSTRESSALPQSSRFSDPPTSAAVVKPEAVTPQQPVRHIPIAVWLNTIGLPEYLQLFSSYTGVEEVLFLQELDVKRLGIKHPGHRARIVTSLAMLRQTYEQHAAESNFGHGRLRAAKSAGNLSSGPSVPLSVPGHMAGGHQQRSSVAANAAAVDPTMVRRMLEAELKLDSRDLRSHAWFHGAITRQQAEAMMLSNGEFLVRESASQPGDYVLTCCWNNVPLHFVINKHVTQSGAYSRVQYGFEGTAYDSVQALIMSYVSEKKRVTQASGATISLPVSRTIPVSLLDRYKELQHDGPAGTVTPSTYGSAAVNGKSDGDSRLRHPQPQTTVQSSSASSSASGKRVESLPHLHTSGQAASSSGAAWVGGSSSGSTNRRGSCGSSGSHSSSSQELGGSLPNVERSESLPTCSSTATTAALLQAHMRGAGSEPTLLDDAHGGSSSNKSDVDGDDRAASDGDLSRPSPGKPSRLPSIKKKDRPPVEIRNKALYDDDGKDYSDYEQVKRPAGGISPASTTAGTKGPVYDKNSNRIKDSTPGGRKAFANLEEKDDLIYDQPKAGGGAERISFKEPIVPVRYLDPSQFVTTLLPDGNKPLEPTAMYQIKETLLSKDYRLVAQHITYLDLHLLKVINNKNLGASIYSGLEAMALPQGSHFREAIIERHYSMSYLVAVTILACTDDQHERALMLKQWILVAAELLRSLGNLFAFCSIAEGLLHPSISRLHGTWGILRQAEPQMTQVFDSLLRTTYGSLNMASSSSLTLSDNVCIPHVLPVAEMLQTAEGVAVPPPPACRPPAANATASGHAAAAELDVMLAHLDTARYVGARAASYHRKGDGVVAYFAPNPLLRDMFKVEFHMKLLYGYHGAQANRCDRYQKFQQILAILSKRAESYDGTEL